MESSDTYGLGRQRLEQLWGTTPWLRQEPPLPSSAPVWPLDNLNESLMDQLLDRYRAGDGSPVREVIVISPFLDPEARAIEGFLAEFAPGRLVVYTQEDTHGLNPPALASVLEKSNTEFHLYHLELERRRLHAKSLLLRTERGAWLASGSANFSRPAWLYPVAAGNTEMVVLRFEEDPAYFDAWVDELIVNAHPLELDWDAGGPEAEPEQALPETQLTLLSAVLHGRRLELCLAERLPVNATLSLELTGAETRTIDYERWEQDADLTLHLHLGVQTLPQLEGPTCVTLRCLAAEGDLISNPLLLHNLLMLKRFGRPVERQERPHVPEGMVPDSYEHCAQLLEMIHGLLATNAEQLRRHRKRISDLSKKDRQEKQMAVEEDGEYDPEAHFVDERVEAVVTTGGSELYDDFYDRLTYDELLRAALSAVYRPALDVVAEEETFAEDSETTDSGPVGILAAIATQPSLPENTDLRAKMLPRIERGFRRLVGNFVQGTADAEYLEQIPPQYHLELFVIITTYLRVVWRDGMLDTRLFVDLSQELLTAFWGQLRQPGAWQALWPRLEDELYLRLEDRLRLSAQTWLHVYLIADLLCQTQDRRVYDLALWMRYLDIDPDLLASLPEDVYRRLWRASFPSGSELKPPAEVVARLREVSGWYDDQSLLAEIGAWPGARARTSEVGTAQMSQVPQLNVTMPLDDSELDRCLRVFVLFLIWPQPKRAARACFTNANPFTGANDMQRIVAFYRGDTGSFVFAAEREPNRYQPEVYVERVKAMELKGIHSVEELSALASGD